MPGEVSLARHGILFLDELPEFRRHVLEVLHQPLKNGIATIVQASISVVSNPPIFDMIDHSVSC